MRRISELFDDLHMVESVVKEVQAKDEFETLDRETEDRILKMAMDKIQNISHASEETAVKPDKKRKKSQRFFSKRRIAFAILVAALVGTLTVSAKEGSFEKVIEVIESIVIKKPLAEKVHVDQEQPVDEIIVEDIAESDTTKYSCEGVTVSVKQVVSDGEDAYVYLSVELPEQLLNVLDESVDSRLYFRENQIVVGDGTPEKINFTLHWEQTDEIYGILPLSLEDVESASSEVSLTLNNLDFAVKKEDDSGWNIERLIEGQWNLQWNINCEKNIETYDFSATIDAHDGTVTTQKVILSPLSMRIVGTIESDDPTYSQVSCNIFYVILKDGTLEEYDSSYSQIEDGRYTMKCYFKRMIPMEDVVGAVVNEEYLYFDKSR